MSRPVLSAVVERVSSKGFTVAMAEINGWRNSMEDAHVIHTRDDFGFFAVFDGHGGGECSAYCAAEFTQRLEEYGCPSTDADVTELCRDIDAKFLDSGLGSGTTGAMCIVHRPTKPGDKVKLRVINVGDSRVLLGRRNGEIVDGGGTDQGLTIDHKPDHPSERDRIYRCGGTVESSMGGVPRVNGDLAVSRGFGDREYKQTGGPAFEDRPVTAYPELGHFECDEADFLVICCDGVSEGSFPNPEVVKLIAAQLEQGVDPGLVCRAVCLKAEQENSKDNVTCMVVLLNSKIEADKELELIPGPVTAIHDDPKFLTAYEAMAKRGKKTLAEAVELRYNNITKERSDTSLSKDDREALEKECSLLGEPNIPEGGPERAQHFVDWCKSGYAMDPEDSMGQGDGGFFDSPGGIQRRTEQDQREDQWQKEVGAQSGRGYVGSTPPSAPDGDVYYR